MANLSIRKLPPELDKAIQREANKLGTTKTEVVIAALREGLHLRQGSPKTHRNVRGFFGKMTAKDYKEFQRVTNDFSAIDEEIWR